MIPPLWLNEVRLHSAPNRGWARDLTEWTPSISIESMDRFDIATAIVSQGLPGVWFGDAVQTRRLARSSNEFAAEMKRNYPGRFGFFATLPLPDVEGSLAEVAYALDVLGADGVGMMTSYGDRWPGDPAFAPLFDELNRRKAVAYFHPLAPECCRGILPDVPPPTVEYIFDTTRAVTNLLYTGTLTRCPDLNFVFSHAGGAIPMLAARIEFIARGSESISSRLPNGAIHELKRLFFEVATSTSLPTLGALRAFSARDRIVFGSDFPYVNDISETSAGLDGFGLDEAELRAINYDNAASLFPQLFGTVQL